MKTYNKYNLIRLNDIYVPSDFFISQKIVFFDTKVYHFLIYVLNYFSYILKPYKTLAKRFKLAYKMFIKFYVHAFRFKPHIGWYNIRYYADRRGAVVALSNIWYFTKYLHLFTNEEKEIFILFLEFNFDYWIDCLNKKSFQIGLEKKMINFYNLDFSKNFIYINKLLDKYYAFDLFCKLRYLIKLGNNAPALTYAVKPRILYKKKKF